MKGIRNNVEVDIDPRYIKQIELLKAAGYKPIAVATLMSEETFCFETEEEASNAFKQFEADHTPSLIQGWWYGKEYFLSTVKEYEERNKYEVLITWLV